ncbi:aspartate aminotransferase family protein [Embleya sp. NPDC008237]|uniref:aspartate aminotransferase family protein n=1 Tax=Embleya sp. NPDC008237 TaxID=3363978 RepID=UPI0036E98CE2
MTTVEYPAVPTEDAAAAVDRRERELLAAAQRYSFRGRIDTSAFSGPVFASARGSVVTDLHGNDYLDFNSGQMCAALGHNHPRILAAIQEACATMLHAHSSHFNVKEIELAARLGELLPDPLTRSLFGASGADANELALLLARIYTGGREVFSPHVSYHGLSAGTRSLTFAGWRRSHDPQSGDAHAILAPYCYRCPLAKSFPSCGFACLDASFELVDAQSTGQPAAVITEPLFSAGGVIDPPQGWLARLRDLCHERGMLLVVDDEQTGLGKLGTMFGFIDEDGTEVVPDIVTLAKHLGGGVDLSSVTTTDEIEAKVVDAGLTVTRSHSNDPLPCAAGIASIDIVVEEDVPAKARALGRRLREHLTALGEKFDLIGDIRGRGMLIGIELVRDRDSKEPAYDEGNEIGRRCFEAGLIFSMRRGGSVLRFVPPASTTLSQVDQGMETFAKVLEEVCAGS